MPYTTYTQQAIPSSSVDEQALAQAELNHHLKTQAEAVAPEHLTTVEISFYDHEYYLGEKLVAAITYDDDLTQPWVVMVNAKEKHRANTWAKCNSYITWHHKQGTLEAPLPTPQPEEVCTTGNEIMSQVFAECEKFGFEILDDGIYSSDYKLGEVGCTDNGWWVMRTEEKQKRILCNSALDAVWWLSKAEMLPTAETIPVDEYLQYQPLEQMSSDELRHLLENPELVAV
ncbi:hypothetical protein ANSO36C_64510 (plasmid) [Nostoc cf. commune SO-36]|uniref:Uncharacterized protein n=1 Tax=Nostoc cf. commune SO-36 TaxID=449208 RepID=A0ABN6QCU4_NOSCO|nr:hypothetical protein [Nostoc commune]BDI20649.1 hypothetical protein ANSO36C_64510 [Nostoc cf. commune SO-36]